MTRTPWNAARGHRGGDGELDIRARARAREREREVVSLRNDAACSDALSDLYHGRDPHPPPRLAAARCALFSGHPCDMHGMLAMAGSHPEDAVSACPRAVSVAPKILRDYKRALQQSKHLPNAATC